MGTPTCDQARPGRGSSQMNEPTARDWLLPAMIVAMGLALRWRQFDYFLVPDSDFFDYKAVGTALLHGDAPPLYLRPPFYSLLMAVLAPIFGGRDPVLHAAEAVNLAAFVVAAFFLYRLAAGFVGSAGAWIVALLFAMDGLGFHMTLQPRAELLTVALVILGCYLATARPAAGYAAAALASLTRYEGAFLVPALLVRDLVFGQHRRQAVVRAALASTGLATWLGLNFLATGHANPYYEYAGGATNAAGGAFLRVLAQVCLGSVGLAPEGAALAVAGALLLVLILGGLVYLLCTAPRAALPIVTFFALTLVLNLAFFSPTPEHAFIIVWVCQLAVVAAFVGFSRFARSAFSFPPTSTRRVRLVLGIGTLLALIILAWATRGRGTAVVAETLLVTTVVVGVTLATIRPRTLPSAALVAGVMVAVPLAVRGDLQAIHARLDSVAYVKGELRRAGEWFAAHAASDDLMIVTEPWVVAAFAVPRPQQAFIGTHTLTAETPEDLAAELRRLGADYVVWNSQHGNLESTSYYFRKYRFDLLRQLGDGRSTPDFEVLDTLRAGPTYAYVYRVRQ